MNIPVSVVVLAKYNSVFHPFAESMDHCIPVGVPKIVVRDGNEITAPPDWTIIQGPERFSMAANHNAGWLAVDPDHDILNLNDDIYFDYGNLIERFQILAYSEPNIGAICASAAPGSRFGNPLQMSPRQDVPLTFAKTSSNGCTYFRREAINEVGFYDEGYTGAYGAEDADYTYRINLAGFKVGIARDIKAVHGLGEFRHSVTIRQSVLHADRAASSAAGKQRFIDKFGKWDVHGEWIWT